MRQTFAPKVLVTTFLIILLVLSLAIMYVDPALAVPAARGICIALTVTLLIGVIGPARRHLAEQRRREKSGDETPDDG